MHGARSLIVLVVLAAGLGAYIYFVENKRDPAASTETKKDKVFTADSATFEEVEIKAASGETTTLKKVNGLWEIVKPEPLPSDSAEIGSLLGTIDTLEVQRVIDENPASAAEFGLEPPRIAISFKAAGDAAPKRLLLGRKTPSGSDVYARVEGQPRVFLISGYLEDSLNKTTFGLRDKTALKFERDGVDALTLEVTGSPTLAFAKKGTDWSFTRPFATKADADAVDSIVGRLFSTKMTAIATADGSAELKKYGLDKPQAIATVGAGSTQARLAIGAKKDDTNLYARDLTRPVVFTVESALLDELKKKPDDLRPKEVFEFRSFSAQATTITVGGKSMTFEKQAGAKPADPAAPPPPDVWKQTKPEAKDADQTKIIDILTTMSNLRAEKFADKVPAGGEEIVLSVRFGDAGSAKTEEVRFRKVGGAVHALRAGDTSAAIVSTVDFDRALALIKELAGVK